jgi:hypothetical protein
MESENLYFRKNEYQKCQILTFCEVSLLRALNSKHETDGMIVLAQSAKCQDSFMPFPTISFRNPSLSLHQVQ